MYPTLDYNPCTGLLFWNATASPMMRNKPATAKCGQGYINLKIDRKMTLGHRIAWAKFYGLLPVGQIDHINGIKHDNRICNLREVTNSQNSMNKSKQSNNTSGYKGVTFHKQSGKFAAKICVQGVRKSLGYYPTALMAHEAYTAAQKEFHGEFSRN